MLYPIITDSRAVMDLSGVWAFKLDDETGFDNDWYAKPLESAMTMPVPASYNDLKESVELRDHYGWVFYQREITIPAVLKGQRVVLRCDAVTHYAKVYIDDQLITEHKGGFLPFEVEIDKKFCSGSHLLTIAVSNVIDYTTLPVGGEQGMFDRGPTTSIPKKQNHPNFDFFNYCGITRPVRIYTTPESYIEDVNVTSTVNGKDAVIHYEVKTNNDIEGKATVYDEAGNKVGESEGKKGDIKIKDVNLWQPMNSYLYNLKFEFGEDEYTLPYGIRTVEVKGTQFLINGKPFYFKGFGKHEDCFPNGRGLNLAMEVKDLSLLKWMGCNSFRTSHYPYPEEMMRLCDREGFVLIDETPAVGINFKFGGGANFHGQKVETYDEEHGVKTFEHHKEVIRDLIDRDKNYACVCMWSIANEPDGSAPGAYEYFKPLYDLAKELDSENRPCTMASVQYSGGPDTDVSAQLSDVITLNRYYGWYFGGPDIKGAMPALREELNGWAKLNKPVIMTEFGADTIMGLHDTVTSMFTEEYQLEYYEENCAVLDEFDCVVGEHPWNFADFATSQGMMRVQGNKKGLFTRDRKPKLAAHYMRKRWNSIPDFDYKK